MTKLMESVRGLHPAYFAMVMATGIVSIAAFIYDMPLVARAMLAINMACYGGLLLLTVIRVVRFPKSVAADLLDHNRCVGFFTLVAGTNVLGSQCLIILDSTLLATILWVAGFGFWFILNYTIFTILTVKEDKPSLAKGINGGWLVAVVATQSVVVLGDRVLQQIFPGQEWVHFMSLSLWLSGGMLYIWIISLIFYRYTFFKLQLSDLMPPYWINMGAMAISTLAGTMLIRSSAVSPFLEGLLPFLKGFTMLFWATATWWIPMLLILGIWRHVYKRFPLVYDPLYWGAVFPLGMYTVCTYNLAQVLELPFLSNLSKYFVYVALAAWAITFLGYLRCQALYLMEKPPTDNAEPAGL